MKSPSISVTGNFQQTQELWSKRHSAESLRGDKLTLFLLGISETGRVFHRLL